MASRDEIRFGTLYETYRSLVWLYCRRRIRPDRVDDVMGDVFLAVWRRIHDAPAVDEALPWLYRVAYLTVSNHRRTLRRRRRLDERVSSLAVPAPGAIADQIVMREEIRTVVGLLGQLRSADAEVLRLAAWEDLNTQQIATVLGIKPAAAKQRLSRARKRLTHLYDKTHQPAQSPLLGKEVSGEQ